MAFVLCLSPFTLFSFAADSLSVKDSGSPVASTFSLRQSASTMSTRAVSLPSAPEGYEWVSFSPSYRIGSNTWTGGGQVRLTLNSPLEAGSYFVYLSYNHTPTTGYVVDGSTTNIIEKGSVSGQSLSFSFDLDESYSIYFTCNLLPWVSDMAFQSAEFYVLQPISVTPPELPDNVISSGFSYSSGIISNSTRSDFESFDFSFGDQPAGEYLINIYHWGDSYDVNFYIYDSNEKYYPVTTVGGCSTFIYNHSGGIMAFDGSFSIVNTDTTAVDGDVDFNGSQGNLGDLTAYPPLSWTFNIENIVAVPLEIAQDSDFGIYSLIVGFLRNQFSDIKSFLAEQFEKISGTDETQADVDSAADELNKEVEDLNNLSGELDNQASSLEQQFTTDFKVPDEISGNASNFQLIYSGIFQSLGIFSVFIWLPVVFAVIKKLLRL